MLPTFIIAVLVDEVQGQYMGLLRFTPEGWMEVQRIRSNLTLEQCNKLRMTGMLQRVINAKYLSILAVPYLCEWGEIYSADDLNIYQQRPMQRM